jgi:hypothetical protein
MESNFYTDEFEQLLKEKADQFRMYPSKRVWHSIYNNLHPSRRWPSAVMSILLFFSLVFTGYLNTSDNNSSSLFAGSGSELNKPDVQKNQIQKNIFANSRVQQSDNSTPGNSAKAFNESGIPVYADLISNESNISGLVTQNTLGEEKLPTAGKTTVNTSDPFIKSVDTYIKTNQVLADVAKSNKKIKVTTVAPSAVSADPEEIIDENGLNKNMDNDEVASVKKNTGSLENLLPADKLTATTATENAKKDIKKVDVNQITPEEKAWIENYALQNKPSVKNKWKDKLDFEFYATPAVNYRKLSVNSKGSSTPFANSDINRSISQKPGFGFETGAGLSYAFAKNLRLRAGVQFNYTNYNINADQTNHPILTTVLMNDPNTGYSYLSARTSSLSNSYNSSALQPVVLHNRTYQVSIPVGLAYKISSKNNVEWFAGATVQPTYVFGGKAHLLSSDLKSYVSDPSSIRNWNLNLGFETYMSYKLGAYHLQVGPQVRYQVYSTYRKDVALIEKPYAVGLKIGIVKGF